jgi:hypothetical protein
MLRGLSCPQKPVFSTLSDHKTDITASGNACLFPLSYMTDTATRNAAERAAKAREDANRSAYEREAAVNENIAAANREKAAANKRAAAKHDKNASSSSWL